MKDWPQIFEEEKTEYYVNVMQKKTGSDKFPESVFSIPVWLRRVSLGILLLMLIPYLITMSWLGENYAPQLQKKLREDAVSPYICFQDGHGKVRMPAEVYLRGVLGGYLYAHSYETMHSYQRQGELLRVDGGNTSYLTRESYGEIAIRMRTNIYLEIQKQQEMNMQPEDEMAVNMQPDIQPEAEWLYFTDMELKVLYGGRWKEMEPLLDACMEETYGKIYGRNEVIERLPLQGGLQKMELETYCVW